MLRPARRIVTGHDAAGRSVVLSDDVSPHTLENPVRPGRGLTDLWRTDARWLRVGAKGCPAPH